LLKRIYINALACTDRLSEQEIRSVAMEEMARLATVNNLLMSIGSPPHFRRQNFPVPAGYHPASLVVRLAPLHRATLAHFIYLERPEGVAMAQAEGFETSTRYQRRPHVSRLTPTAEDFDTVGHLYRGWRRRSMCWPHRCRGWMRSWRSNCGTLRLHWRHLCQNNPGPGWAKQGCNVHTYEQRQ
jgi:hypothetical protein